MGVYNSNDVQGPSRISVAQIVLAALTIVGTLLLPIYLIEQGKHSGPVPYTVQAIGTQAGRVAGAQDTSNIITLPVLNVAINLNSEAGMLTIGGLVLLAVAIMLIIYLLVTGDKRKHR